MTGEGSDVGGVVSGAGDALEGVGVHGGCVDLGLGFRIVSHSVGAGMWASL